MIIKKIETLNKIINEDEVGSNWRGYYPNLSFYYQNTAESQNEKSLSKITNELTRDIWKLSTIFYKIEYFRLQSLDNNKTNALFGNFITLDIEHSHILLRSLFDNLAVLISATASKNGQLHDTFNSLLEFAINKKERFLSLTDESLHIILMEYRDWFISLREIRDDLTHRNFNSLVFGNLEEDIYFWIKNRNQKNSVKGTFPYYDLIRYNIHDVVSFTKYSGINFALLINLMEDVSKNIIDRKNHKVINHQPGISSEGFKIAKIWSGKLL